MSEQVQAQRIVEEQGLLIITSPAVNELIGALCVARLKFDPIVKDKVATVKSETKNTEYRYRYADLADVLDSTAPHLADNGIILLQPPVTTAKGKTAIQNYLAHKSGQFISALVELPPLGDRATPQQLGSLITYLRRYSACALLGISSQFDDDDGKAASTDRGERMDPKKLADFLAAIEAASDDDQLKDISHKAQTAAEKDKTALARIIAAKSNRYKQLHPRVQAQPAGASR